MLIDLSQPYCDGMFSQKLFPPVRVNRLIRLEDRGVNVTTISAAVHVGTHIDAPSHFIPGGKSADQIDLEAVSGYAVCWEVNKSAGQEITASDLEAGWPQVQRNDMVFIRTGWEVYFHSDHRRYSEHPHLSLGAAEWLVQKSVKMLAVDTASPDMMEPIRPDDFAWPVHHLLLEAGILVAENLNRLDRVAGKRFKAYALPIPIVGSDGAPARIVADL